MHILITGICGFAGSSIARGLLERLPGLRITGIDNQIRKGSQMNLNSLRSLGISVHVGDIRNESDLAALPASDWLIDCAANPSVLAGVDGSICASELFDHNLGGTIHLLEYCRRHRCGFILLSTSRVYSIFPLAALKLEIQDRAFRPAPDHGVANLSMEGITEQFSTEPPVSLYGSSKRCSELIALEYAMTFDFPVWINRCGVLAGAGQFGKFDQGVFSYWIHSWAARRSLEYIGFDGTGCQVRDFLHPRDIVSLLIDQMNDPLRKVFPIMNISGGRGNSMSLAQMSDWCAARFGNHQVTSQTTPRPFDIPWLVLDSSEAGKSWNWKPVTPLTAIFEEIARHAETNPHWLSLVS